MNRTLEPTFRWKLPDGDPVSAIVSPEGRDTADWVERILRNRGIAPAAMAAFLDPSAESELDPLSLSDVDKGVARIRAALARGEMIAVYGDYDADGITATALLVETLERLGGHPIPYLPNRHSEGYGLNNEALTTLCRAGVGLVITVDCGVSSHVEVEHARQLGLDVVITDHHRLPATPPLAAAIINPKREDNAGQFRDLAGVGVAYKVAQALVREVNPRIWPEMERSALELVALGTVADVVPMLGENRVLVRRGLDALNRTERPGLRALAASARLPLGSLDESHIGFGLAPRLNAAGRLGDASTAYDLLVAQTGEEAEPLARFLEGQNALRQKLTQDCFQRACELWEAAGTGARSPFVIVQDHSFEVGILGLVASKLVELFNRPALVLEHREGASRGSARSVPGFDVGAAVAECADLLKRHGGHSLAAGLTVANADVPALRERLNGLAGRCLADRDPRPELAIDLELPVRQADWRVYRMIELIAPFGVGNPEPVFLSRGARVEGRRRVGREGKHLQLFLAGGTKAIGFGLGELAEAIPDTIDLAYSLAVNDWNGTRGLEARIRDLRRATEPSPDPLA